MNYLHPKSTVRHPATIVLRQAFIAVIKTTWALIISGSLIAANGCDRPSDVVHESAAGDLAKTEPIPPIAKSSTPTTNSPSAVQYTSSGGQALVSGTSTLHNWTVTSNVVNGNAKFSGQWNTSPVPTITLVSIDLSIPVDGLKSTEGGGMDNTMYDALNLKQFPTISYNLTKASLKTSPARQGPAYEFDTTGQLTVAGASHQVALDLDVVAHDDGGLTVTTDTALKMSDFGIKPPTAMLGMIKSGDAITVKVTWQLAKRTVTATAEK